MTKMTKRSIGELLDALADKEAAVKELTEKNFNLSEVLHRANVAANFAGYAAIGNDPAKVINELAALVVKGFGKEEQIAALTAENKRLVEEKDRLQLEIMQLTILG